MVRTLSLLALPLALAACDTDRYRRPITVEPHGAAVRHNMAAQIIAPAPAADAPMRNDAQRAMLMLDRYRQGRITAPDAAVTSSAADAGG